MGKVTVEKPKQAQKTKTKWYASYGSATFLVGQTVPFTDADGRHIGLYNSRVLDQMFDVRYDRHASEQTLGLWAHFIFPSVTAESGNGHHLVINTYDRARFTFGFYQLAAHTPNDNLILFFREALKLATASTYFPDLFLKGGRVHRRESGKTYSLEKVTKVHRPNGKIEDQLLTFMTYLNPDTTKANVAEALSAAKLMHWLHNDPAAVQTMVKVAFSIMKRKIRSSASSYGLKGRDPRLGIWVSDIRHQGRGKKAAIKAALNRPTLSQQLEALASIDVYSTKYPKGRYLHRRNAVQKSIELLEGEKRFEGVTLGDASLPL